tara:strand:+ start:19919 stop:20881 length:963 start_codon:yes stop_codon:yes gene_type:complete
VNIYLTFDYELFFGEESGTVEKCMLQPTEDLLELARGKNVSYTFFVDVGYLIEAEKYPQLRTELQLVKTQINKMLTLGHDVQLHIHPHWEKATWDGKWSMNISNSYKLSDFSEIEITAIVKKYKSYLDNITGNNTFVFRAGGWCIEPFILLKDVFKEVGIRIDSSVFPGVYLKTDNYSVNFLNAPRKSKYYFENSVCDEDEDGSFIEYPISSFRYSPSFYWWLFGLGKLFPTSHKMIGDGQFISQGGRKWHSLTSFSNFHVSTDGYYAKKLKASLQKSINLNHAEMVVIGHPKGNTIYSLRKLNRFIDENHTKHSFKTFV